jgi:TPR repeat protein
MIISQKVKNNMKKFSALLMVLCIFCLGANNIEVEAADNKEHEKEHEINFDLSLSLESIECLEHFGKRDKEKGMLSCSKACDKGDGRACYQLAGFLSQDGNINGFIGNIMKGCSLGYDVACNRAGMIFSQEPDIKFQDIALEYYMRGCELENMFSCTVLGKYFYENAKTKDDLEKALSYFERACHYGDSKSCYEAGDMYRIKALVPNENNTLTDEHFKETIVYSEAYLEKSCENGCAQGCNFLAKLYDTGSFGEEKQLNSYILHEKACDLNSYDSCFILGGYYSDKKNKSKMKKANLNQYYEVACKGDIIAACAKVHPLLYKHPIKENQVNNKVNRTQRVLDIYLNNQMKARK